MLMFSFMLCSFKRKSNLGFSCSPDHFGKLLSFIYSFKIWKFGHQIILVKWYPSYKYVLIWDMKTSSPGHVEAELVAKYLINFIDIQNLDQINLKKDILGKKTLKSQSLPWSVLEPFQGFPSCQLWTAHSQESSCWSAPQAWRIIYNLPIKLIELSSSVAQSSGSQTWQPSSSEKSEQSGNWSHLWWSLAC